jgi:hypothetical protein
LPQGTRNQIELPFVSRGCQRVVIAASHPATTDGLPTIASVCCWASSVYFESALRLNSEILHGISAIAEIDGETVFLRLDNVRRAAVDPSKSPFCVLVEVAHRVEAIEKRFMGQTCDCRESQVFQENLEPKRKLLKISNRSQ